MADNETVYRITVDTNGAVTSLNKLSDAQAQVSSKAKDAGSDVSGMATQFAITTLAAQKLGQIIGSLPRVIADLAEHGDKVNDVAEGFENLTQKAGVLSSTLLSKLQAATQGTVSNFSLMREANDAMLAGLKPEQFVTITQAAKRFGDQLGLDTVQAVQQMTQAIETGRTATLKQYHVYIDANKLVRQFAEAHGAAAEQVTGAGRAFAIAEEATKQLNARLAETPAEANGAGDSLTEVFKALTNARDSVASAIDKNPQLAKTFHDIAETVKQIDFTPFADGIGKLIELLSALGSKFTEIARGPIGDFVENGLDRVAAGMRYAAGLSDSYAQALDEVKNGIQDVSNTVANSKLGSAGGLFGDVAPPPDLHEKFSTWVNDHKQLQAQTNKTTQTNKDNLDGLIDWGIQSEKNKKALEAMKELEKANEEATKRDTDERKKFTDQVQRAYENSDKFRRIMDELKSGEIDATEAGKELTGLWKENTQLVSDYNIVLATLNQLYSDIAKGNPVDPQRLADLEKQLGNLKDSLGGTGSHSKGDFFSGLFGNAGSSIKDGLNSLGLDTGAFEGLGENIGSDIGQGLASGLSSALSSDNWRQGVGEIGGSLGSALGSELGPVGSMVGNIIGKNIFSSLANIGSTTAGSVKGISTILTGGLASFIPDSVFDGLFGDSKKDKAKKAADKFFADIFNAQHLQVIINGQLKEITDLQFSGNQEGGIYANLDKQTKTAFDSIGKAFEGLLGIGEDVSTNLGAVFANNVGGELNNLQLLVEATGKSFDELSQQIITTFLNGKESVLDVATALQQLQGIMTKGIPGATGAVGKAFDNIFAAGSKGGRALLDAIGDVAAEAQELGIKDLPGLKNALINTFGESTDKVALFFAAMKAAGINSLTDLLNASQQTLIAIAADMEAIKNGQTPTFTGTNLGGQTTNSSSSASRSSGSRSSSFSNGGQSVLVSIPGQAEEAIKSINDVVDALVKVDSSAKKPFETTLLKQFKLGMDDLKEVANELGFSFEQMQQKAVDSFKAGKTSALDASNAIGQSSQGLSDVVGGFDVAFKNLQSHGTKGGFFSLNDLRNLGAEGSEAGFKTLTSDDRQSLIDQRVSQLLEGRNATSELVSKIKEVAAKQIDAENNPLEQLRKGLLGKGVDEKQVSILFDELKKQNITTIEQLTNLSDVQGTTILGDLQKNGFAFGQTSKDITKLLDQTNKAKNAQEVTITVNVKKGKINLDAREVQREVSKQLNGLHVDLGSLIFTQNGRRLNIGKTTTKKTPSRA